MKLEEKTVIAALLHDIGKVINRYKAKARKSYSQHAEETREFLRSFDEELAEIAYGHHKGKDYDTLSKVEPKLRKYAEIICESDNLSAGLERLEELKIKEKIASKNWFEQPMLSILSTIDIGKGKSEEMYFDVREITLEPYYLRPKTLKEAGVHYEFWEKLKNEIIRVLKANLSFDKLLFTISNVLKKYTFFVPADTTIPDTSLYEHMRLSAIFAYCMLENKDRFILIKGDISGIQDFIVTITSKKALRFLKGRSFYLELLNLASTFRIVKELGIPSLQILSCAAGNFTIIAPAKNEIIDKLKKVIKEINKEILNLGIYIAVEWEEFSFKDVKDFGNILKRVDEKLGEKKSKRYYELMEKENYEWLFRLEDYESELVECEICKREVRKEDLKEEKIDPEEEEEKIKVCKTCYEIYKISKSLINLKDGYIGVYWRNGDIKILGIGFKITKNIKQLKDADYILKVNSTDFLNNELLKNNVGLGFRFFNTQAAETRIDELVKFAEGADYIGIMKMDGDDIGRIFSEGISIWWGKKIGFICEDCKNKFFPETECPNCEDKDIKQKQIGFVCKSCGKEFIEEIKCPNCKSKKVKPTRIVTSPSRYATLSSLLEIFYGYCVERICKDGYFFTTTRPFSKSGIYVVYSGGDDFFVIGPWNQILDLSLKIKEELQKFTNNPNLTVSSGILVCKKKFPVYKSYQIVVESLESAKEKFKDKGKDAISIFNEKIRFEELDFAKEVKNMLIDAIERGVSRAIIYSILRGMNHNAKFAKKWAIKYVIARFNERYGELGWLDKFVDDVLMGKKSYSAFLVGLRWTELLTRR